MPRPTLKTEAPPNATHGEAPEATNRSRETKLVNHLQYCSIAGRSRPKCSVSIGIIGAIRGLPRSRPNGDPPPAWMRKKTTMLRASRVTAPYVKRRMM